MAFSLYIHIKFANMDKGSETLANIYYEEVRRLHTGETGLRSVAEVDHTKNSLIVQCVCVCVAWMFILMYYCNASIPFVCAWPNP